MAVDHERPLPVDPQRIKHIATQLYPGCENDLSANQSVNVLTLAMLGELIEHQQNTNFFLGEAYDIYNARWR